MLKKITLWIVPVLVLFSVTLNAQTWKYTKTINFPAKDTFVTPYLMTMDSEGRLYVASSRATSASSHNAVYYLDPGDTVFKPFINYNYNLDSDTLTGNIGEIRGLATMNKDLFVIASQPYPKTKPNTTGTNYVYRNRDTLKVEKYGFGIAGSGYGTFLHGAGVTKDSILFTAISFMTSIRFYNFSDTLLTPGKGSWIPVSTYPMEIGGATSGLDIMRDLALQPGGNYAVGTTPFYTSRTSKSSVDLNGGISAWTGGNQLDASKYTSQRVTDAKQDLAFATGIPYGIYVDHSNALWVAGTDSTRRWVKAFDIIADIVAIEKFELPAKFSTSVADTNVGAPLVAPSDVILTPDMKTAYVSDLYGDVYKFEYNAVGTEEVSPVVTSFELNQNYPNPFNPSTVITFAVPEASNVKLVVSNALGQEVATLFDGYVTSGSHSQVFNATDFTSGVYFYSLISNAGIQTKKMVLMK